MTAVRVYIVCVRYLQRVSEFTREGHDLVDHVSVSHLNAICWDHWFRTGCKTDSCKNITKKGELEVPISKHLIRLELLQNVMPEFFHEGRWEKSKIKA